MNVLANSTCPLLLCILGIIVGAVYGHVVVGLMIGAIGCLWGCEDEKGSE